MSGTVTLSLTQIFDNVTRDFLEGGRLYFYAPGTTTPQNAFTTAALSTPLPNPLTLESDGRVPYLWFADGTIRIRCTNAAGVLQFDFDNMQVFGSSGGGGGVDTTDPNSIFQTGMPIWMPSSGVKAGWVRMNGRTIGSAASGASERASADCELLFNFLWNNFIEAICPVLGGRGATSAADWSANKQIVVVDMRNRSIFGLPDMGSSDTGAFVSAPIQIGGRLTPGSTLGELVHTLTLSEIPTHTPSGAVVITDPGHPHGLTNNTSVVRAIGGAVVGGGGGLPFQSATLSVDSAPTGITAAFNGNSIGGGAGHNIVPTAVIGTWYMRL